MQLGRATLAEAMFLHLLKGDPEKPSPAVVGKIQGEANYVAWEGIDTRLRLGCVRKTAQKLLAE